MFHSPIHDAWIEFRKHYRQVCIQNGIKANNGKALKDVFRYNLEAVINYMQICNGLSPFQQLEKIQMFFLHSSQTMIISAKKKRDQAKQIIKEEPHVDFSVPSEVMQEWHKLIAKKKETDFSVPNEIMEKWRQKITKCVVPCEYCQDTNPCDCQFSWNVDLLL